MRRYLVPIFLLLMAVAVGAMQLAFGLIKLPLNFSEAQAPPASKAPAAQRLAALPEAPNRARSEQPSAVPTPLKPQSDFDIARIDPGGTSVFAGKTAPKVWVTVLADGKPVGTARADDNGEWTLVTTGAMPASPRLSVATSNEPPPMPKIAAAAPSPETAFEPKAQGPAQRSADAVGREIVGRLEAMVAEARAADASRGLGNRPAASSQGTAASPDSGDTSTAERASRGGASTAAAGVEATGPAAAVTPVSPSTTGASPPDASASSGSQSAFAAAAASGSAPPNGRPALHSGAARQDAPQPPAAGVAGATSPPETSSVRAADASSAPSPAAARAAPQPVAFAPIPIMFHYREARFTDEGQKAAELLLEYVRLKQLGSLRLTGHADERGTVELNMDLSRDRLETVSRFLRVGGYQGTLDMIPKGKSEPFAGVDRKKYPQEVLYQLDRRVELRAGG